MFRSFMATLREARPINAFSEISSFKELSNGEARFLLAQIGILQDRKDLLKVADQMKFKQDPVRISTASKIAAGSAYYGVHFDGRKKIHAEAERLMRNTGYEGVVEDITSSTGFSELLQVPGGLEENDYSLMQQIVMRELSSGVFKSQGISPKDIDLVLTATSIPIDSQFGEKWKIAAGIRTDVPVVRFCMACNSSGRAIAEVLTGKFNHLIASTLKSRSAKVLLMAGDDGNRKSKDGGDALSAQIFSTGASIISFEYHPEEASSMRMITHTSMSDPFGTKYLRVLRPYDGWNEGEKENLYTAQHLQVPEGKGAVYMSPRASLAFITKGQEIATKVVGDYIEQGEKISNIRRVIVHHPSLGVFQELKKRLINLNVGFTDEQIKWVINEGNVPVATIPIAFGRQLEDLKPGDHVMFLSFGAGGEYTCFIVEMGNVDSGQS